MVTKEERAEAAAARAARVKELKESAHWRVCPRCGMEPRWNGSVLDAHNRWDAESYQMVFCEGSAQPPLPAESAPQATFTDAPVGAEPATAFTGTVRPCTGTGWAAGSPR